MAPRCFLPRPRRAMAPVPTGPSRQRRECPVPSTHRPSPGKHGEGFSSRGPQDSPCLPCTGLWGAMGSRMCPTPLSSSSLTERLGPPHGGLCAGETVPLQKQSLVGVRVGLAARSGTGVPRVQREFQWNLSRLCFNGAHRTESPWPPREPRWPCVWEAWWEPQRDEARLEAALLDDHGCGRRAPPAPTHASSRELGIFLREDGHSMTSAVKTEAARRAVAGASAHLPRVPGR